MSNPPDPSSISESIPEIADYEFPSNSKIGEGSYGEVWYGLYKKDQPRAVKVFKPGMIRDDLWRSEFEKLKALDEPPGIVTLYDQGETADGLPYVAMRLMAESNPDGSWRGRTLMEWIGNDDLSEELRWRLIFEIAEILAFLHRQNVYHCDVKPGNVLLSTGAEPRPVLCDFGQSIGDGYSPESATGTFLYASPEQLMRKDDAIASWDVYSFGVTAWQLLTGRLPRLTHIAEKLPDDDAASILQWAMESISISGSSIGASLDRELIPKVMVEAVEAERDLAVPSSFASGDRKEEFAVIARCLALGGEHRARYSDMAEVSAAFEQVARDRVIAGEKRKRMIFVMLTAFGLVTTALAGWQWFVAEEEHRKAEESGQRYAESAKEQMRLAREANALRTVAVEKGEEANLQKQIAEAEREKAIESEQAALQGRSTAETLINSMLYDLKGELEVLGRVDLLDEVSSEAANYFANLPESQRTESSERERSSMLNNRGEVFLAKGQIDEAKSSFKEALAIRKQLLELSPESANRKRDLSVTLERMGDVMARKTLFAEAEAFFHESLKIRERLDANSSEVETAWDLAVAQSKIAGMRARLGDLESASEIYDQCLEGLGPFVEEGSAESAILRDFSAMLLKSGDLHRQLGVMEIAGERYQESVELMRGIAVEADSNDVTLLRDFAAVLFRFADWNAESGNLKKAQQFYKEALPLMEAVVLRDSDSAESQRNLALLLGQYGRTLLDVKALDEAKAILSRSVAIFEKLSVGSLLQSEWLREFQYSLIALGDLYSEGSRWADADDCYSRALSLIRDRASDQDTMSGDVLEDLVVTLYKSGEALSALGGVSGNGKALLRYNEAAKHLAGQESGELRDWLEVIEGRIARLEKR